MEPDAGNETFKKTQREEGNRFPGHEAGNPCSLMGGGQGFIRK